MPRKTGEQKSADERSGSERRLTPRISRADEGSEDDAPSYGDWQRHSSGGEEQGRRETNRGPRGRRRTDESLAAEIREILIADPELEATDIEVEVEGGAVTLRGMVVGTDARLLAEELVETIPGVREVHNRLKVDREGE